MIVEHEGKQYLEQFGFNSLCCDNRHILIIDYDTSINHYKLVNNEIKEIQRSFELSNFYIIKTKHGFHAICLDKLNFKDILKIRSNLIYQDKKHYDIGIKRGKYTLALKEDNKLFSIIHSKNMIYQKSNPHRLLLNIAYHTDIKKNTLFDNCKELHFEKFYKLIKGGINENSII